MYRHLPAQVPVSGVLDLSRAGLAPNNRWNAAGEPTLYLAGDVGVAIAEWARHFAEDRGARLGGQTVERTIYRLELAVERLLDLRDPHICRDLYLADAPYCFLDRSIARATAQFVRNVTTAQGLLVPSMALLDSPERWVMALFLDKLPADPTSYITAVTAEGPLRWR